MAATQSKVAGGGYPFRPTDERPVQAHAGAAARRLVHNGRGPKPPNLGSMPCTSCQPNPRPRSRCGKARRPAPQWMRARATTTAGRQTRVSHVAASPLKLSGVIRRRAFPFSLATGDVTLDMCPQLGV
ncbi:hypothetical protein PCL_07990 [Purpureocillium lilacinum]|uniref:Uncharacterized protein n=1 Tax=Purpureocillium lilacinum TaxID=33203 RepID=A0A2U3EJI0_PURLI|nr:hypothetical protein PCL_07990 [Purpureocillium lilacinum]